MSTGGNGRKIYGRVQEVVQGDLIRVIHVPGYTLNRQAPPVVALEGSVEWNTLLIRLYAIEVPKAQETSNDDDDDGKMKNIANQAKALIEDTALNKMVQITLLDKQTTTLPSKGNDSENKRKTTLATAILEIVQAKQLGLGSKSAQSPSFLAAQMQNDLSYVLMRAGLAQWMTDDENENNNDGHDEPKRSSINIVNNHKALKQKKIALQDAARSAQHHKRGIFAI